MKRYHISEDGQPRVCSANKGQCPLGEDSPHGDFSSEMDARKFAEEYNAKKYEREAFMALAKDSGDTMRQSSRENKLDEFAEMTPEEVTKALTNPGTPIQFNPDGSLTGVPSGTVSDPFDLAQLRGDQAEAYLLSKGYDAERIASLKEEFSNVEGKDLSERALITAATVDLMVGPPQGHVRFSEDPEDNYSFSMSNFSEIGEKVGMISTDPNSGFLIPTKDPKASLSWMQVSNPANNVFQLQHHLGVNRLFMPQTANKGVTGAARAKLEEAASFLEKNSDKPYSEIARNPEWRRINTDLQLGSKEVDKLKNKQYVNKKGEAISKDEYLSGVEMNGATWMTRDMKNNYGFTSSQETYGNSELAAIKPTQSGISVLQVQGMAQATINNYVNEINRLEEAGESIDAARSQQIFDSVMGKRTIVTQDNYIIDGHHGLAKAALLNSMINNGSLARQLRSRQVEVPFPTEARLGVVKMNMNGGQAFDAVTKWTADNGFPVSGMQ